MNKCFVKTIVARRGNIHIGLTGRLPVKIIGRCRSLKISQVCLLVLCQIRYRFLTFQSLMPSWQEVRLLFADQLPIFGTVHKRVECIYSYVMLCYSSFIDLFSILHYSLHFVNIYLCGEVNLQ